MQGEGYDSVFLGRVQSARHAQEGFIVDWGYSSDGKQAGRVHRANLIEIGFSETDIGVVKETSSSTAVGKYVVTPDFDVRAGEGAFLLGMASKDRDGDGFYSMVEGLHRLKVEGAGRTRGCRRGGHSIEVGESELRVELRGGPVKRRLAADVDFGAGNVNLDVVDKRHLLTSGDLELKRGRSP